MLKWRMSSTPEKIVFQSETLLLILNEVSIAINHPTCPEGFHAAEPLKLSKHILQKI